MEIFDEMRTENEKDSNDRYYLRSKRRKLTSTKEEITHFDKGTCMRRRKCPISFMPTEILILILKQLPCQELCNTVRLVNRRFKVLSENIVSTSFKQIECKLKALMKTTIESIQSTHDDMEIKCLCKMLNMLDVLHFQQSVVMSTIWRYVYNEKYTTYVSCMYAGVIVDTYRQFLWKYVHIPNQLYGPAVLRDYDVFSKAMPDEVINIIQMTKNFCLHFEKNNEEPENLNFFVSGAKILDLLDTASFATKDTVYEKVEDGYFSARYNYYFHNAWFVALDIQADKQMPWKHKQRMMHMRIRRIILAHTEMFMQEYQYEREMLLRSDPFVRLRKPSNNVYTGYGDIQDKFFYYGVMNDGAFAQKFHPGDLEDVDGDEFLAIDEEHVENGHDARHNNDNNEDAVATSKPPYLDIHIDVRIKCPLPYSPFKYFEEKSTQKKVDIRRKSKEDLDETKDRFNLRMEFNCPGAQYPRLPTSYIYNFKHKM